MAEESTKKRKAQRPKRMKSALGPYATQVSVFDAGDRALDVTVTPEGVWYHAARATQRFFMPHGVGYSKAVALSVGFNGDSKGPIKRSVVGV